MAKELTLKERVESAKKIDADFNFGLNEEQVKQRQEDRLVNKTKKTVTKSYFKIIVDNVFTVLNMILIAMAVVMFIFHADISNFFFLVVLLINIGISLFQDIKARHLVNNLSLLSNPKALVVREGIEKNIPFDNLVLSDIVIIKQGNTIPTDGILVDGSVKVNESILTGEMNAIKKNAGDQVYGESIVIAGTAKYKVTKIGNLNYASTIQERAKTFSRPKSEILSSLTKLIRVISVIAIVLGAAQLILLFVRNSFSDKNAIKFASSIIAMIPNGMYLMTSIALTVGVIVLSHNKILVRELYSIEMLARVNVVCVDKTGTVTDGNMIVEDFIPIGKKEDYVKQCIANLLFITKDDNLTAHALRKFVPFTEFKGPFFVSLPFESEKKYSAASYEGTTVVLGAAGFFKVTNMKEVEKKLHALEGEGKRIMLVAESKTVIKDEKLPSDLKVIGIIVIVEHIKDDAKDNIEWFKKNGVNVKMISGDAPKSLTSIAQQVGIDDGTKVVSLEGMSDDQVRDAAGKYNVFGRVLPEQKRILVDQLRKLGNTVAMVGDGVNDLLALKQADCSIAMANGSDAVKAASHLVSLDSNFSSLPKVVGEGRRVINNLQRVCSLFLVKTVFAITLTLIFFIFGLINKDIQYPYIAKNLIMWETLTIGLAPFILALEPNINKIKKGFLKNVFMNVIPAAVFQLVIALTLLLVGYYSSTNEDIFESYRSMSIILITIMSLVTLYNVCIPFNKYRGFVAGGITIFMGLCFLVDFLVYKNGNHEGIFGINYFSIEKHAALVGSIMLAVIIPIYLFVGKFFRNKIKNSK